MATYDSLRRRSGHGLVVLAWDQHIFRERFWLVRDYLPEAAAFDDTRAIPTDHLADLLGGPSGPCEGQGERCPRTELHGLNRRHRSHAVPPMLCNLPIRTFS
ncbi:hypothetical protein [Streptomyces sp. NPDC046727]|uniref:hypothetical protein n=1 Tax=Streptomyces sp. NPDC046727 TaxID=3155373 RepID=UPI003403E046